MNHQLFLSVKDHSVSKQDFTLFLDSELDLVYTFPQPDEDHLPRYYESEDYISHTDGKRSVFEKAYQFIKSIALKNKIDLIGKLQPQKGNLLDIGAGTGDFLNVAGHNGWHVTGVEPSQKAKEIASGKGISFAESTTELNDQSFDVITMWHVLEHVPNIEKQVKELKRLLKPNGTILVAVPNFHSFDANHYGKFWAAYDVPRHLWHFSRTAIRILFEREDLQVKKTVPMPFDAFYVALLSEKYQTGKMNFIKAFYIGLKSNWKAKTNLEYSSHIYIIKNRQDSI
jgi:2-polyprenyl-3-methyl-5-hydroxy-6-metoxy-1,4-benzoquinol methylase